MSEARIPMSRLSQEARPAPASGRLLRGLLTLALLAGLSWGGFQVAAEAYRQRHCVLLFGHWMSIERTTIPVFCQ